MNILDEPFFVTNREYLNIANLVKLEISADLNKYEIFDLSSKTPSKYDIEEKNGVSILRIRDTLIKNSGWSIGMDYYATALKELYNNKDCKAIILIIESGGGQAAAMRFLAEVISLKNKPVIALCDDCACSAAYGIASCCDLVFASSPLCEVGSIGTLVYLFDMDPYYKSLGINIQEIYATLSVDKNLDVREALEGKHEKLRAKIDVWNNYFLNLVAENRGGKLKEKEIWGTGKTFFAPEAIEVGLIDGIASLDEIINSLN